LIAAIAVESGHCCDKPLFGARRGDNGCAKRRRGDSGAFVDEALIQARRDALRQQHRDLDAAITALAESGAPDQLQMARLKKRKLRLRDEIALLDDTLVPDIIA